MGFPSEMLRWAQEFTGIDLGEPKAQDTPPPAPAPASEGPVQPPAEQGGGGATSGDASGGGTAEGDRAIPRPMPEGMKLVHGKVPGPKNHVLSDPDGFVVDTDKKLIIANSLDEYKKAHPPKGEIPTPTDGPLGPGDEVLLGGNRYVIFEDEIRVGGTVSWHARNPGNIRDGDGLGAYPGKKIHTSSVGAFAIFPDEAIGMAAVVKVLKGYSKLTILEVMNKYAPKGDGGNDPEKYANAVASAIGASSSDVMNTLSDAQITKFSQEIKRVEGWKAGTAYKWDDEKVPEEIRSRLKK